MKDRKLIVIGCSSGGVTALQHIFCQLPKLPTVPIVVVQHIPATAVLDLELVFGRYFSGKVLEAMDKTALKPGHIYFAPAGYHLLIESDYTLSISQDEHVNFARPSIDVLFESAAFAIRNDVCGVLLTGSNSDGALGLMKIKDRLGYTIVQDPATAESPTMPQAALNLFHPDMVGNLDEIAKKLAETVRLT